MGLSERGCYFRYCLRHPRSWWALGKYAGRRLWLRGRDICLQARRARGRLGHYPSDIRELVRSTGLDYTVPSDWQAHLPFTGWKPGTGPALDFWEIPLATRSLSLATLDWGQQYEDREDLFSLHRFGWLLRWLSLAPTGDHLERADALLIDWAARVRPVTSPACWETYSVSERVVNWLLYFAATGRTRQLSDRQQAVMAAALAEHLRYICLHLEYYGTHCNNHILNNARALYIGGGLLRLPGVAELGRQLLVKHSRDMIHPAGTLLEGSSHYQLLLTRTFVEVLWVARVTDDHCFFDRLAPLVGAMVACSGKLAGGPQTEKEIPFPLIGDLSPDYPVSWFFPFVGRLDCRGTWWGLWDRSLMERLLDDCSVGEVDDQGSGWQILADPAGRNRVVVYDPLPVGLYPAVHGHLDYGSFCFRDHWGEVLVDSGRYSYQNNTLGNYGSSAVAHNVTLINGLPLLPATGGLWGGYRCFLDENHTSFQVRREGGGRQMVWGTKAPARLGVSLDWKRHLEVHGNGLRLKEEVKNPTGKMIELESYLHLAPDWQVVSLASKGMHAHVFQLATKERVYELVIVFDNPPGSNARVDLLEGGEGGATYQFPGYGRQVKAPCLKIQLTADKDFGMEWALDLK